MSGGLVHSLSSATVLPAADASLRAPGSSRVRHTQDDRARDVDLQTGGIQRSGPGSALPSRRREGGCTS